MQYSLSYFLEDFTQNSLSRWRLSFLAKITTSTYWGNASRFYFLYCLYHYLMPFMFYLFLLINLFLTRMCKFPKGRNWWLCHSLEAPGPVMVPDTYRYLINLCAINPNSRNLSLTCFLHSRWNFNSFTSFCFLLFSKYYIHIKELLFM